jgi:hypothetical protein
MPNFIAKTGSSFDERFLVYIVTPNQEVPLTNALRLGLASVEEAIPGKGDQIATPYRYIRVQIIRDTQGRNPVQYSFVVDLQGQHDVTIRPFSYLKKRAYGNGFRFQAKGFVLSRKRVGETSLIPAAVQNTIQSQSILPRVAIDNICQVVRSGDNVPQSRHIRVIRKENPANV